VIISRAATIWGTRPSPAEPRLIGSPQTTNSHELAMPILAKGEPGVETAVLTLLSSIVGGLLVLAGQYSSRRAEDRRHWLTRLQETAGDYATSFLEEGARINDTRRAGKFKEDVVATTYIVDRQKALGRSLTLPWASSLEQERLAMGRSIDRVWVAWNSSDEEFQAAYKESRAPVMTPDLVR
jgi:hypothetical protein